MKKLLLKILILIVLIYGINLGIYSSVNNNLFFTVKSEIKTKEAEILKLKPAVLIIGSSRSFTTINPEKLDILLFDKEKKIYNYGTPALFFPVTNTLLKSIYGKMSKKPEIIFIELGYNEVFSTSFPNQINMSDLYYLIKNLSFIHFSKYLELELSNYFKWTQNISYKSPYQYKNGYLSTLGMSKTNENDFKQHLLFLKNGVDSLSFNNPNSKILYKNKEFEIELINKLINQMIIEYSKDTKIYFYFPNRINKNELSIIKPVFDNLPDSIKFNPNKSPKFGQLMKPEYSWDQGHLTEEGSTIYTKIFAEEFQKQIIDKGYLKN